MKDVQDRTGILLTTTPILEGYRIVDYCGVVGGQSVIAANFIKDFFARVRDVAGGPVGGYETALHRAMSAALEQMALRAERMGANAVIGIDIDTGSVGPRMLTASSYGTAVRIERTRSASGDTPQYANPILG